MTVVMMMMVTAMFKPSFNDDDEDVDDGYCYV